MQNFTSNFNDLSIEDKDIYDYNYLVKIAIRKTTFSKNNSQKYNIKNSKYIYCTDPNNLINEDNF